MAVCFQHTCLTVFRAILSQDKQADQDKILQLSSHSLKATLLSWTAKVGIVWDNQTLIGYHVLLVSRSALTDSQSRHTQWSSS